MLLSVLTNQSLAGVCYKPKYTTNNPVLNKHSMSVVCYTVLDHQSLVRVTQTTYCLRTKRQNNMARVEHLDDSVGTESTEAESDKRDSLEDGGSSVKMNTYRVREETGR